MEMPSVTRHHRCWSSFWVARHVCGLMRGRGLSVWTTTSRLHPPLVRKKRKVLCFFFATIGSDRHTPDVRVACSSTSEQPAVKAKHQEAGGAVWHLGRWITRNRNHSLKSSNQHQTMALNDSTVCVGQFRRSAGKGNSSLNGGRTESVLHSRHQRPTWLLYCSKLQDLITKNNL